MIAERANIVVLRTTWVEGFHISRIRGESPSVGLPEHRPARDGYSGIPERGRGVHEGKEANPVQGDPADARRAGTVLGRRRRGQQRPIQPGEVSLVWPPKLQVGLARV